MRRSAIELHIAYARDLVQRQSWMLGFGINDGLAHGRGERAFVLFGDLRWGNRG